MKKLKLLGWNLAELDKYPSSKIVETYHTQFPQTVEPVQLDEDNCPFIMVTCKRNDSAQDGQVLLEFSPKWFTYQEIEE